MVLQKGLPDVYRARFSSIALLTLHDPLLGALEPAGRALGPAGTPARCSAGAMLTRLVGTTSLNMYLLRRKRPRKLNLATLSVTPTWLGSAQVHGA